MALKASIDIGSNSVLLCVAEVSMLEQSHHPGSTPKADISVKEDHCTVTGLGREIENEHSFHPGAMELTWETLKGYKAKLGQYQIEAKQVICTATEAARKAKNARKFFDRIKTELGFHIQILNGRGEAYYSTLGVKVGASDAGKGGSLLIDLGGASTELVHLKGDQFPPDQWISLPLGSVRSSEILNGGKGGGRKRWENWFRAQLGSGWNAEEFESPRVTAVAGTFTALTAMLMGLEQFDPNKVHGHHSEVRQWEALYQRIFCKSADELTQDFSFLGKRAPLIVPGLTLALALFHELKVVSVVTSTWGLRHGLLVRPQIEQQYIMGGQDETHRV